MDSRYFIIKKIIGLLIYIIACYVLIGIFDPGPEWTVKTWKVILCIIVIRLSNFNFFQNER